MKDIALKPETLRTAHATATVTMPSDCLQLLHGGNTEKGNALEAAKIAAIMAAKSTSQIIPYCHPINLLDASIDYELNEGGEASTLIIETTVKVIAPTGVEMEALTAASAAALTVYDMLKPHTSQANLQIGEIRLLKKTGGKSHFRRALKKTGMATAAILVLSDTVAAGKKQDTAGAAVRDELETAGFSIHAYEIHPDEPEALRTRVEQLLSEAPDLILTVGGTGISPRDKTVEAIQPLITTEMPGLMEAARVFGQRRTPYSLMSRGIAGMAGNTLIATFPGSSKGAVETLAAIQPGLIHLIEVCRAGRPHSGGYGEDGSSIE